MYVFILFYCYLLLSPFHTICGYRFRYPGGCWRVFSLSFHPPSIAGYCFRYPIGGCLLLVFSSPLCCRVSFSIPRRSLASFSLFASSSVAGYRFRYPRRGLVRFLSFPTLPLSSGIVFNTRGNESNFLSKQDKPSSPILGYCF